MLFQRYLEGMHLGSKRLEFRVLGKADGSGATFIFQPPPPWGITLSGSPTLPDFLPSSAGKWKIGSVPNNNFDIFSSVLWQILLESG